MEQSIYKEISRIRSGSGISYNWPILRGYFVKIEFVFLVTNVATNLKSGLRLLSGDTSEYSIEYYSDSLL